MSCPTSCLLASRGSQRPAISTIPIFLLPRYTQHRTFIGRFLRRGKKPTKAIDTNSPEFKAKVAQKTPKVDEPPRRGGLARNSIIYQTPKVSDVTKEIEFDTPRKDRIWQKLGSNERKFIEQQALRQGWEGPSPGQTLPPLKTISQALENRQYMTPSEEAQLRTKVRERVFSRGRLNRKQLLARSERALTSRSPFIKTSIKKLGPLARQIAGKKLLDAMVQMRFSKKKAAKDVLKHLEYARNKATVQENMGLGLPSKNISEAEDVAEGKEKEDLKARREAKGGDKEEMLVVRDRKGKKRVVEDRSEVYVDQAWVGRGKWEYDMDYRARGQGHRLYKPYTSITVLLKEERTRLREAQERQAKRKRKAVWVNLPDRPVTAQRQYPLW